LEDAQELYESRHRRLGTADGERKGKKHGTGTFKIKKRGHSKSEKHVVEGDFEVSKEMTTARKTGVGSHLGGEGAMTDLSDKDLKVANKCGKRKKRGFILLPKQNKN